MSSAPQSQGEEVGVAAEAAPPAPLDPQAEYAELIGAFRAHLLWLRDGGVAGIPRSAPGTARPAPLPAARPQPPRPEPPGREDRQDRYAPAPPPVAAAPPPEMRALFEAARAEPTGRPPPSRSASRALAVYPELPDPLPQRGAAGLDFVRDVIGECTRCKLCHGRNSLVFGQGAPAPPVVFVGEGPGAEEDRTGLPFVGAAGDLLTRMIGAMGLSRDDVYRGRGALPGHRL